MDLITNSKQLKRGIGSGAQAAWSETEVEQLRELYDKHKDDNGKHGLGKHGLDKHHLHVDIHNTIESTRIKFKIVGSYLKM